MNNLYDQIGPGPVSEKLWSDVASVWSQNIFYQIWCMCNVLLKSYLHRSGKPSCRLTLLLDYCSWPSCLSHFREHLTVTEVHLQWSLQAYTSNTRDSHQRRWWWGICAW